MEQSFREGYQSVQHEYEQAVDDWMAQNDFDDQLLDSAGYTKGEIAFSAAKVNRDNGCEFSRPISLPSDFMQMVAQEIVKRLDFITWLDRRYPALYQQTISYLSHWQIDDELLAVVELNRESLTDRLARTTYQHHLNSITPTIFEDFAASLLPYCYGQMLVIFKNRFPQAGLTINDMRRLKSSDAFGLLSGVISADELAIEYFADRCFGTLI